MIKYPDSFPVAEVRVIIDAIRGRNAEPKSSLAHAAWVVMGYAMREAFGEPGQPNVFGDGVKPDAHEISNEDEYAADVLESVALSDDPNTKQALPPFVWELIIRVLMRLLERQTS